MLPLIVFISVMSNGDGSLLWNAREEKWKKEKKEKKKRREEHRAREREREVKSEREK